jgi:ferritin-like metal-binding protein YciE
MALADSAGASADRSVLEQSMKEEQEMGDWLGENLPNLVSTYLQKKTA